MLNIFNEAYDYFFGESSKFTTTDHQDAPPIELFMQFYAKDQYTPQNKLPEELVRFEIDALCLADSKNLGQPKDIEYIAKFLSNFCKDSKNYNLLSTAGKERIDSIFHEESQSIQKAITKSGCRS